MNACKPSTAEHFAQAFSQGNVVSTSSQARNEDNLKIQISFSRNIIRRLPAF